ncbi:hypothetical protein AYI69_g7064 [Smittium culicis]|uniref:Uncharacterized protein n=1 Tax=Smittium culicis TaxID=133412 RepID=A0A1R1XUS3_9FUNG|nr:hypothetical protein AYI69_g7064 [Smittium culicis]
MFQQLRLSMIFAPLMVHPETSQPHSLSTDSCYVGVGASLNQKHSKTQVHGPCTELHTNRRALINLVKNGDSRKRIARWDSALQAN